MIDALKNAAERCDTYHAQYGVIAVWKLGAIGLELTASYGAEHVTRYLAYNELEQAVDLDRLMRTTEEAALSGLSS